MLLIGQPQNLGRRTMMLILARRTTIGFVVFLCSIILAFLGPSISYTLVSLMSLGGSSNSSAVLDISNSIASILRSVARAICRWAIIELVKISLSWKPVMTVLVDFERVFLAEDFSVE